MEKPEFKKNLLKDQQKKTSLLFRSALAFLASTMIGVGYLTLPIACKAIGIALGMIIILIAGTASMYSGYLLLRIYRNYECDSYPELVKIVLGTKHFLIMNLDLLFYGIFSSTMYIYFGNEIFLNVLQKYNVPLNEWTNLGVKIFIFLFALIMSFFKIEKIRWFGYVGTFFSLYTAVVLICQLPLFYDFGRYKEIVYFQPSYGIFIIIGACFFAFTNHFSIIPIMKNLQNENDHSNFSAHFRSHYFPFLLYTSVAFAGYLSFGEKTPDFILLRNPLPGSYDIWFSIGQVGIVLANIVCICIRFQCNRDNFLAFFKKKGQKKIYSKKKNNLILCVFGIIAFFCSLLIKKELLMVISLMTSVFCPYFIVIAPSILKSSYEFEKS